MTDTPLTVLPGDQQLPGLGAPPESPDDTITLTCPDCDATVTGRREGRGSAKWKLSTHAYNQHGKKAEAKKRKGKTDPQQVHLADRPGLAAVADIRSAAGGNKRTSAAPTADDLAGGLGRAFELVTVSAASFLVETDRSIPDDELGNQVRESLIEYLSIDNAGATNIAAPIGRLLAPTKINARYGRSIVQNADVVGSFSDLALLFVHWRQVMRARSQPGGLFAMATNSTPAPVAPVMAEHMGTVPMSPVHAEQTTPAPMGGTVVTAEDVARMQMQRGN